jgi:hypothetical protein
MMRDVKMKVGDSSTFASPISSKTLLLDMYFMCKVICRSIERGLNDWNRG